MNTRWATEREGLLSCQKEGEHQETSAVWRDNLRKYSEGRGHKTDRRGCPDIEIHSGTPPHAHGPTLLKNYRPRRHTSEN